MSDCFELRVGFIGFMSALLVRTMVIILKMNESIEVPTQYTHSVKIEYSLDY